MGLIVIKVPLDLVLFLLRIYLKKITGDVKNYVKMFITASMIANSRKELTYLIRK